MITVGLFGFGRTGKVVAEEIMKDPQCELKWVAKQSEDPGGKYAGQILGLNRDQGRIFTARDICSEGFYSENPVDVIIDFSASSAVRTYEAAAHLGTRIVSAVSNYPETDFDRLKRLSADTAVLWSPNITLGINLLILMSKLLKQIIPGSDIEIIEEHHNGKKDISGTALRIAEELGLDRDTQINSIRVGGIVGRHEVIFGLPNQTIRIVHESLNKAAFGQGAIYAAKWLVTQKAGLYTMEEAMSLGAGCLKDC